MNANQESKKFTLNRSSIEKLDRRQFACKSFFASFGVFLSQTGLSQSAEDLQICVVERDGYARRSHPVEVKLSLDPGQLKNVSRLCLIDSQSKRLPVQLEVNSQWADGSVREASLFFKLTIPPHGKAIFHLGHLNSASEIGEVGAPVQVNSSAGHVEIKEGPVVYHLEAEQPVLPSEVLFGTRSYHLESPQAASLLLKDGMRLQAGPATDTQILSRGPIVSDLVFRGNYGEKVPFLTRLRFFSGKSWFSLEHELGPQRLDSARELELKQRFRLKTESLQVEYGSRRLTGDVYSQWSIMTDGETTVEVASLERMEAAAILSADNQGLLSIRYPARHSCRLYYHYLIGPPDSLKNTHPAAMVARPGFQVLSSGAKGTCPGQDIPG